MLTRPLALFCRLCPQAKSLLWERWYRFLMSAYDRGDWTFMNYGCAPAAGSAPEAEGADEGNRNAVNLYRQAAAGVDLAGRDVLEVGSGRGGGAAYISRHLRPRTMVGVDLSRRAVEFSTECHAGGSLSFRVGNAEDLPFPPGSFDAVINVESSHCYRSMERFLGEVSRVLRDGGFFLFADFRGRNRVGLLRRQLRESGMELVRETDITRGVVAALDMDSERRTAAIRRTVHGPVVPWFLEFAGIRGSGTYEQFRTGRCVYLSWVLRKPVP